ncbi:hypothetical protein [Bifidobacterium callitrichidarum]|uniref:hypothetical protein n=1 Tax=Bifidobacterium callitrichidarum TaxID=2052941 RepID=UPI001F4EAE32|nr:hypothetical protein [Bifidobacterium callitrichidarum]
MTNTNEERLQRSDGPVSKASKGTWTKASGPRQARATIIGAIVVIAVVLVGIGLFVSWGLAAIAAIIMIPGAISLAILARHPESTGGRSMLGISNPDTLLDPLRRPSERRGK